MALEKQVINLPMAGGLQEVLQAYLLDLPFMQTLQNCVFRKEGTIEKRYGSTVGQTTGLPTTLDPNCVFDHNGALVQHTPHGTYALSDDNTRWRLANPAATRPVELESREIVREGNTHHHDSAVIGNLACYVWQRVEAVSPACWVTVVELDTGAVALVPTKLPSTIAHKPRVIAFDNTFVIAAHSSTTLPAPVYAVKIATTTIPLAVSAATRIDNTTNITRFDCHAELTEAVGHFAFSSTTNTYIAAINKSLTTVDSDTMARESNYMIAAFYNHAVAKFFVATRKEDVGNVLVHSIAYAAGAYGVPSLDVFSRAPANAGAGDIDLGLVLGPLGSTGTMFLASCTEGPTNGIDRDDIRVVRGWNLTTTGAYAASSEFDVAGYEIATKMYRPSGWESPVLGLVGSNFQGPSTGLLVTPYSTTYGSGQEALAVHSYSVLARFHQEIVTDSLVMFQDVDFQDATTNANGNYGHIPQISLWSTPSKFVFSRATVSQFLSAQFVGNNSIGTGPRDVYYYTTLASRKGGTNCIFTVTPQPLHQSQFNRLSVFNGGNVSGYDGLTAFETAPHHAPYVAVTSASDPDAVDGFVDGEYAYAYYFYFEDRHGNIHRGPVWFDIARDYTAAPGEYNKTTHTVRAWPLSALDGQYGLYMKMAIYRTTELGADPTSNYYLIRDGIQPADAAYLDEHDDADITGRPLLYTTGDVLEASAPPSMIDLVSANGRCFGISGEQPNTLWYTKPAEAGVAPEWVPENTLRVPDEGGEIVALASLDDKVVVFKEKAIFYFFGEGPNALGQDGSFSDIRAVSIDVGCENKKAVVSGPFGVMFQAERGFYILGRDLALKYIPNVENSIEDLEVNAAVTVPNFHEIRFSTENGEALSYNYLFDRWSAFTDYDGVHACLWESTYVRVQDDYRVFLESSLDYTDDSNGFTQLVETPWIKVAGLQGFARIWRALFLGKHLAQYFKVEVGFNYEEAYNVSKSWSSAEITALDTNKMQLAIHLPRQKVDSIRFRFYDHGTPIPPEQPQPVATGAGYTLAGLALEVGIKKGTFKNLPDGAKK